MLRKIEGIRRRNTLNSADFTVKSYNVEELIRRKRDKRKARGIHFKRQLNIVDEKD